MGQNILLDDKKDRIAHLRLRFEELSRELNGLRVEWLEARGKGEHARVSTLIHCDLPEDFLADYRGFDHEPE